jgi:hypothetical protein
MKLLVLAFLASWAVTSSVAADGFLKGLPPEQFAAAGLNKLTPEELGRLEQLVAERETGARGTAVAKANAAGPGWLRALVTLQETAEKPDAADAIETRLAGDYRGWTGKTVFNLENGQAWQQVSGGERIDDKRASPAVRIYPGMMGAYWLEIEGVRERVKVKPVKLK